MQQTSSVPSVTTRHCVSPLSPCSLLFVYSLSWHFSLIPDVQHAAFSKCERQVVSIGHSPLAAAQCPDRVGISVGSLPLQQPQGLLFLPALGMLCQPLNATSLVAFVETACA